MVESLTNNSPIEKSTKLTRMIEKILLVFFLGFNWKTYIANIEFNNIDAIVI
jgi:hypothetical protein